MGLVDIIKKGAFVDILRGMSVTGTYFVVDKVTVEYPKEKLQTYPRFRGVQALLTDPETGDAKCVACMLCATICPSHCISIVGEQTPERPQPSGDLRPGPLALHLLRPLRRGLPRGRHRDDPALRAGHLRQERLRARPRRGWWPTRSYARKEVATWKTDGRARSDAAVREAAEGASHDREGPLSRLRGACR